MNGVPVGVRGVAEHHEWKPGGADACLGLLVLVSQSQGAGVGVDEAGVGDQAHAGFGCGLDRPLHLGVPLPEAGRGDEQDLVGAGERGYAGFGPVVVRLAHLYATLGEVGGFLRAARGSNDVGGGDAAA